MYNKMINVQKIKAKITGGNLQMKDYTMNTKCVQAGYTPGNGEPRQIPIIQSTTFRYETSEDMGKLLDRKSVV